MAVADIDETMELEFSEEDVAYYIVDEDDNEIGIALYDQDGNEVEYYYAENAEEGRDACALVDDAAFEIEVSEDDIAYYIEDEDGNEIGFALIEKDGTETEYYYEGVDASAFAVDGEEAFEIEFSEDDIAYYIEDEDGNEIGFALRDENGSEVEYYYEGVDADAYSEAEPAGDGHSGRKPAAKRPVPLAKRAGTEVGKLVAKVNAAKGDQPLSRKAGEEVGKLATKATTAAKDTAKKIKNGGKPKPKREVEDEDLGFGLTSSGVKKAAGEFTSLAKDGAQAAAELRGVYDDIVGDLDFLKPSPTTRVRRR